MRRLGLRGYSLGAPSAFSLSSGPGIGFVERGLTVEEDGRFRLVTTAVTPSAAAIGGVAVAAATAAFTIEGTITPTGVLSGSISGRPPSPSASAGSLVAFLSFRGGEAKAASSYVPGGRSVNFHSPCSLVWATGG
jgi:hypothetical protein